MYLTSPTYIHMNAVAIILGTDQDTKEGGGSLDSFVLFDHDETGVFNHYLTNDENF